MKYKAFTDSVEIMDSFRMPVNKTERAARIAGKSAKELYPYYGATGQAGVIDGYLVDGEYVLLGEDGAPFLDAYAIKAYLINGKAWINNHAHILKSKTNNKFLCYYLNYFNYKGFVSGTTRLKLTQADMKRIPIPDFSIEEQARIVARLEELFSDLDAGVETLQKIKQQLSVYRQTVLNNALQFHSKTPIKECIEDMGQGWSPKCDRINVLDDDEWAVITTTSVQPMNFIYSENKKLPETLTPREKHEIREGDLLITRAGPRSRCGICCLVRKTKKKLINCDKVYRIRVLKELILPEFLEAILNSPYYLREIEFCKTGGNDSGVNLTQDRFLSIRIPVPTINEQIKALAEIESRMSICDSIEETVDQALQQSAAMHQSILKQAFEGGI